MADQLAPERALTGLLFGANVALAALQFVEPWLLGRVIDALVSGQSGRRALTLSMLSPLVAAWVAVGLVNIGASVLVSLHAERLSHRVRLAAVSHYFRHVLSMPLAFHVGTHSGRVMKVMLSRAETLWFTYLGFFRDHASSLVALFVLLPCSLLLEWRLGLLGEPAGRRLWAGHLALEARHALATGRGQRAARQACRARPPMRSATFR